MAKHKIQFFNDWIDYWRLNIHRFAAEYLGIKLSLFQQVVLYLMDSPSCTKDNSLIFFASRGIGKSFLTMVFCICKCVLYPNITIKVASSTMHQATMFASKLYEIQNGRPNVEREIDTTSINRDSAIIKFKNGSTIEAVVCADTARGARANILILDESRLMSKATINNVLMPFLTKSNRDQPWAMDPRYRKYMEREHNSTIYLTSIGYKDEWSYQDFKQYCEDISAGDESKVALSLPYQFAVEGGIIRKSYIENRFRDRGADITGLRMEFEVIPHGESESAMFTFDEVNSARQLRVPLIPPTDDEYIECNGILKTLPYYQKKEPREIRVLSMDIAVGGGRKNDLTVFTVFRCIEDLDCYDKELSYIEVMSGVNLDQQVIRVKQLFYDLECDYAVIDAGGAIGIETINSCGNITKDMVRNRRYPGWKTMNKVEKYDMRIADPNAEPVLFPIQISGAGASAMQYNMLVTAQLEFQRKRISLLVEDDVAVQELNKRYKYLTMKTSNDNLMRERANNMIGPFANTTSLVDEAIKTQIVKLPSGRWVYDEKNGRKDRVISMIYGLYFINLLEEDLISLTKSVNISDYVSSRNYTKKNNPINPFGSNLNKLAGFGMRR